MPFVFQDPSGPPPPGIPSGGGVTSQYGNYSTQYNIQQDKSINDPFVFQGSANYKASKYSSATAAEHGIDPANQIFGSRLSDLQRKFIQSGAENQRHWAYLLALVGYAGAEAADPRKAAEFAKTAPLQDVLAMHKSLLSDAADQFNVLRRKVTPAQLMKEMLRYRLGDQWDGKLGSLTPENAASLGGTSLAGKHTTTSRSVDLMSPEDAKGMVRSLLQQELGRDPTQAEYEDFIATIHAAERANPSISRTTYTTNESGNTTSSSTTTRGGLSASGYEQALYEKARKMPSWGIWQAMGTYAPALFEALDAPISGV